MLYGVLILNEVLDFSKRKKRKCLVVKVDFEKAYDCVSWRFLRYVFNGMDFGQKWLSLMEVIVFSRSLSILMNCCPTDDFMASKGIRRGGPLSHFLFLLVEEALFGLMRSASDSGSFKGFQFNEHIHF